MPPRPKRASGPRPPDRFDEMLQDMLAPIGPVTIRRMFGGKGVFRDGLMFGLVADDTLYLRVDDQNRAAFAEAGPESAFRYSRNGQVAELPYWRVPERLMDEPDELAAWAREAMAASRRVAAKKPPKRAVTAPPPPRSVRKRPVAPG